MALLIGVKHLNPRQGITTFLLRRRSPAWGSPPRVKHLNPRQGITTGIDV